MRQVTNSDGQTKQIHSSHGDVPHPAAGPQHAAPANGEAHPDGVAAQPAQQPIQEKKAKEQK